jgi:hypothetical protein
LKDLVEKVDGDVFIIGSIAKLRIRDDPGRIFVENGFIKRASHGGLFLEKRVENGTDQSSASPPAAAHRFPAPARVFTA